MHRFLSLVILVLLTTSTSSCTLYHIDSVDTSAEYYPSKTSINEISYVESVTQPNEVVGTVIVNAERRQYIREVVDKMKREAAILGADAITNIQSDATGEWLALPRQKLIGNAYVRANFKADAVVFK